MQNEQEQPLRPSGELRTKEVPYFWGELEGMLMNPQSLKIPAYEIHEPSEIPRILRDRGYEGPIQGIDVVVQSDIRDPNNGKFKRPSVVIEEYSMHIRVRTSGGREEIFTLDRKIIELYLTKRFEQVYHQDFSEPANPGAKYPNLQRLRQRVKSHELTPSDKHHSIKVSCVIYRMLERLMHGLGEGDARKYSLHVLQRDKRPHKMEVKANSCEDARAAAQMINFEPTQHIPEQIIDLTADCHRRILE